MEYLEDIIINGKEVSDKDLESLWEPLYNELKSYWDWRFNDSVTKKERINYLRSELFFMIDKESSSTTYELEDESGGIIMLWVKEPMIEAFDAKLEDVPKFLGTSHSLLNILCAWRLSQGI